MASELEVKNRLAQMLANGLDDVIIVDSRASSLNGRSNGVRCFVQKSTGFIIVKDEVGYADAVRAEIALLDDFIEVVLIVDDKRAFNTWDNTFDSNNDLSILVESSRIGLGDDSKVMIHDKLMSINPSNVLQTKMIDESGQKMEFDNDTFGNGHLAIMMAIKTAENIYNNGIIIENTEIAFYGQACHDEDEDEDDGDNSFMPFTV